MTKPKKQYPAYAPNQGDDGKNQNQQSNPNPLKNNTKSILCMIYHDQGTKNQTVL
jgi:hypothetical protein